MKMLFQVRQTNTRTSAVRSDPNSNHNGQKATVHWTQDKSMFFILTVIGARILSINRTYLFHVSWKFNSQGLEDTGPTPKATCLAAAIAWSSSFDQTRWPSMITSTWYTSQWKIRQESYTCKTKGLQQPGILVDICSGLPCLTWS